MAFQLRIPGTDLEKWAAQYDYAGEPELIAGPVARARKRGYPEYSEFLEICGWKSARNKSRHASNSPEFVDEVLRLALAPKTSPRLAIESLTLLAGVQWPTASAILHFCHVAPYPILDFRALWSLSTDVPSRYTYPFWREYSEFTRTLAQKSGVTMRILDRALWKYSEVHQDSE
jgi:hypothetical protein